MQLKWDPQAFTSVQVSDRTLVNGQGNKSYYQLIALPTGGVSRHDEPYTNFDFWVTTNHEMEFIPKSLPQYVSGPPESGSESTSNTDIVLWYKGAIHHHPSDEDGEMRHEGGKDVWHGQALVMWTGFMLKPHNVFDRTPFYP